MLSFFFFVIFMYIKTFLSYLFGYQTIIIYMIDEISSRKNIICNVTGNKKYVQRGSTIYP